MDSRDLQFLRDLARAAILDAMVPSGTVFKGQLPEVPGFTTLQNLLGFDACRPGGRDCYPAIWVQDFTMAYACGLIEPDLGQQHLELIAACQAGEGHRVLQSGAEIPAWSVPDHINLDGSAVFFPGTYSAGSDQGGEPYGMLPPANNAYDFVWLLWLRWTEEGRSADFLQRRVNGMSLLERAQRGYDSIEVDPSTQLVWTSPERRRTGFIFCDSIFQTGHLLMASLIRRRAALQLAEMWLVAGDHELTERLTTTASQISRAVPEVFADPRGSGGWLRACTGVSSQADVWGTIYAVWSGALQGASREAAIQQLVSDLERGVIEHDGALRHVPTDRDARPDSAWEQTPTQHNRYQNGAYWSTPIGWAYDVLREVESRRAEELLARWVQSLREEDFRKGPAFGAPWEALGTTRDAYQNAVFLPSITLPLSVITRPARAGNPTKILLSLVNS